LADIAPRSAWPSPPDAPCHQRKVATWVHSPRDAKYHSNGRCSPSKLPPQTHGISWRKRPNRPLTRICRQCHPVGRRSERVSLLRTPLRKAENAKNPTFRPLPRPATPREKEAARIYVFGRIWRVHFPMFACGAAARPCVILLRFGWRVEGDRRGWEIVGTCSLFQRWSVASARGQKTVKASTSNVDRVDW
jgi:hypothetical protein